MTPWSLRTVTPDTVKIMKRFDIFQFIHSLEIALQSQNFNIFLKKSKKEALALKGIVFIIYF